MGHLDMTKDINKAALADLPRAIAASAAAVDSVLETVLPSAVRNKTGIGYNQMVRLVAARDRVQEILEKTRAPKRRSILARLLQLEPDDSIDLVRLAGESGATPPTSWAASRRFSGRS